MKRLLIGSLVVATATALLAAQTPAGKTPVGRTPAVKSVKGVQDPDRINRRAKQMREQLGTGKYVRSHVRVQVRLKNGNRLRGVVKDGRLVERVNGLRFEDAHAADKGAGIRLWYAGGTRNYVFVPFAELKTYNVLERLTQKQIAEIEAELQMREVARDEQLRREQQARDAGKNGMPPVGPGGETAPGQPSFDPKQSAAEQIKAQAEAKARAEAKAGAGGEPATGKAGDKADAEGDKETSVKELHRKWFKLVQDYPPDQGWNAAKRDEISRRFAVIGARPSAHEQRFVDEFAEWKKACDHFGAGAGEKSDGPPAPAPSNGRRSRRGKK